MAPEEISTIRDILNEVQKQLAIQGERERQFREHIVDMAKEIQELRVEVTEIRNMANRWKGGFLVLAGLGGLIGWLLSTWSSISSAVFR